MYSEFLALQWEYRTKLWPSVFSSTTLAVATIIHVITLLITH